MRMILVGLCVCFGLLALVYLIIRWHKWRRHRFSLLKNHVEITVLSPISSEIYSNQRKKHYNRIIWVVCLVTLLIGSLYSIKMLPASVKYIIPAITTLVFIFPAIIRMCRSLQIDRGRKKTNGSFAQKARKKTKKKVSPSISVHEHLTSISVPEHLHRSLMNLWPNKRRWSDYIRTRPLYMMFNMIRAPSINSFNIKSAYIY